MLIITIPEMHPRKHKNPKNSRTLIQEKVPSIASFNIPGTVNPINKKNKNALIDFNLYE